MKTKPIAPIAVGIATCMKRSPLRSELRPISTMPAAAAMYGSAEIKPTSTFVNPDRPFTMVGTQSVRP